MRRRAIFLVMASSVAMALAIAAVGASADPSEAGPGPTKIDRGTGRFVPIPDEIPHAEGAYVDSRIVDQLRWITDHFEVFVIEGFAGPLPSGKPVGCPECHVRASEHKIGLAVDLIPIRYAADPDYDYDVPCNRAWRDATRLARWAEPSQGSPVPPFRWVGYEGDRRHGCGDHLHLSWAHDRDYKVYRPSDWVRVFSVPPAKLPLTCPSASASSTQCSARRRSG